MPHPDVCAASGCVSPTGYVTTRERAQSLSRLISRLEALAIRLDGASTVEAPVDWAEEARSHLKKLEAALVEANDDLECGLIGREAVDSARLRVATKSQKILAEAIFFGKGKLY